MAEMIILFADNDRDFLDTRSEFLEAEGYRVLKAYSPEDARAVLDHRRVHLAILDIRLRDDSEGDISGLELAQEGAYEALPKIMLTGFPTVEAVRVALKPRIGSLPLAVDYIPKKGEEGRKGPAVLIETVEHAFVHHVRIDRDLLIRWGRQGELLAPSLVGLVHPDVPPEWLADWAGEFEDALRKLFYGHGQLTLGRVLARREGRILLSAFTYPASGLEQQFVVACGRREKVAAERKQHESFVPQQARDRSAGLTEAVETIHFGAAAYRLPGCAVEETTTLAEFYHRRPTGEVLSVVDDLFEVTLRPWYERARLRRPQPLTALCQGWLAVGGDALDRGRWDDRVDGLAKATLAAGVTGLDCAAHRLTVRSIEEVDLTYPNPVPYLCEQRIPVSPSTLCGVVHGSLDGWSVLVDRVPRTWLVDFERAGQGPLVRDFVSLETAIKFDMLAGASVKQRHALESRLLDLRYLGEEVDTEGIAPEVKKALKVIGRIRFQAADVIGPEMEPYLMGLLYCAARRFLAYHPQLMYTRDEVTAFAHALLSMGMLCQRLVQWKDQLLELPPEAAESLWLDDDNQEVWVEGRRVVLPPQRFRLIKYLYDHANQLCTRPEIARDIAEAGLSDLGDTEVELMEKDHITTLISRLRKDIEPDSSRPKYIITVRSRGYKLEL